MWVWVDQQVFEFGLETLAHEGREHLVARILAAQAPLI